MPEQFSRRSFLTTAAAGAGVFLGMPFACAAPLQRKSPNVVMIVSDDQGWNDFGFTGNKIIQTPHLDRMAKDSAVFPFGYVPASLCRASLATLLTGLYPFQHCICCNDPPPGVERSAMHPFIKNAPTLPRLLGAAGYESLQTGKFWEGHFSNAGFTHGQTTNQDRHIAPKPQIGRDTMQPIYDFIDKFQETPFFIWYAPMMPHLPHNPPERILKRYAVKGRDLNIARYFGMCEWLDETIGQLLDHLDKRKLTQHTLVTFNVDNGWITPTAKEDKKSPFGAARGKQSPYEMGVRTPILLRWPAHTKPGRYNDLVQTIDLAPTILTACNLKPAARMLGLNLLDVAAGKGKLPRTAVYGELYRHTATQLAKHKLDVTFRWMREGDWKLILPADPKVPAELYNLAQDPEEKNNLTAKQSERVKMMTKQIEAWWQDK
jgi:arylsulfatase A-like enzyme